MDTRRSRIVRNEPGRKSRAEKRKEAADLEPAAADNLSKNRGRPRYRRRGTVELCTGMNVWKRGFFCGTIRVERTSAV